MPQPETVLITGASSGIGLELARLFAAERSELILLARREHKLAQLADSLRREFGIAVRVVVKDLARQDAAQQVFDELTQGGTQVDVLVNNAGFGARGTVAELPAQLQMEMIQLNVTALARLTLLFLPGMLARNQGGILNVGSTAGFQPGPLMCTYYATKAFVLSFTEGLAEELRGTKLHVTCLAPGPTVTEFAAVANMTNTSLFKRGPMSAAAVARAGYKGFRARKTLVVPGFKNKLGIFLGRLAPRGLVRKVVKQLQS